MDTIEEQVNNFSNKCNDLLQSKFIVAPSKISDLLRSIAASPALVSLFEKAAKRFDYLQAQEKYILPSPDGTENKGILLLPDDSTELLAFIFCLLVDIDNQTVNFNLFLQTFFAEDGSYTQAYDRFLSQIIRPFQTAVCEEFFPRIDVAPQPTFAPQVKEKPQKKGKKNVCNAMLPLIKVEVSDVSGSSLPVSDRQAGIVLLNELYAVAKNLDEKAVKALLVGYYYFVAHTGKDDTNLSKMFDLIEEL